MSRIEKNIPANLLIEIAWEVCNQVGGIHTVVKTKAPTVCEQWGDNYLMVGPYIREQASGCFEQIHDPDIYKTPVGQAIKQLQDEGLEVYLGRWLIVGRPLVVLLNPYSKMHEIDKIKFFMWENHSINTHNCENVVNDVLCFGVMIKRFLDALVAVKNRPEKIITHFHEWMAASCIPDLRKDNLPISTVFTTHATILARYLAMHDNDLYSNLASYNWEYEANRLIISPQVKLERAAAHGCHVFSTVSNVTAQECTHLLGRTPDVIVPNGINIERFTALHEFQNLHQRYKQQIHQFVAGHFFPSYTFDLDRTLYFFTSGRFEYKNKGFDMTLEALRRLNYRLKEENIDKTIVMFFITRRPNKGVLANVLQKRAMMTEIRRSSEEIEKQLGEKLFRALVSSKDLRVPNINDFVDEYSRIRMRRLLQSWKDPALPTVITHDIYENATDEILNYLRYHGMHNSESDRVKIVYHPDFLSPSSPLLPLDYAEFVRGCHLGLFLSSYEPWGYTPLECIASGVPTVTTDLTGFGDYVIENHKRYIQVIHRKNQTFNDATNQTVEYLFDFVKKSQRSRISFRNKVESSSTTFDWSHLFKHYEAAYDLAAERVFI